jgi:hypothetical protein
MSDDQRRFETEQRNRQLQGNRFRNTLETVALARQTANLPRWQQILFGLIALGVVVAIVLLVLQVI